MLSEDHVRWAFAFFAPDETPDGATIQAILANCRTTAALRDHLLIRAQYFRKNPDFVARLVDQVAPDDEARAERLRWDLAALCETRLQALARERLAECGERIAQLEEQLADQEARVAALALEAEGWREIEADFLAALSRANSEFRAIFRAACERLRADRRDAG